MTKEQIEKRKAYERGLHEAARVYVREHMTEEQKDKIFRIAQGDALKFKILQDNPDYKFIRDRAIARDIFADALSYEIKIDKLNKKFVDKYIADWDKIETSDRYRDNALKGLKSKFKEQYVAILNYFEEDRMNPNELHYIGDGVYQYRNIIISFQNSPAAVEVRIFD